MTMKKLFRKVHLWLSVPFGIFITLICFSGAMLAFEKEITEWCRPELYFVERVGERPLPLDELMEKTAATLPDTVTITGVTISPEPERAYQVSLSKPRRASIYVDQYTGEIKGRPERLPFFDTMFHLHRWMMGSAGNDGSISWGKLLVGVSTLVLVFILLTGILMWLTNKKKPLASSLKISFTQSWPRFWHDLHVAGGIYATIFLLAIALTGLTWSFSWYRTGFYALFGVEASADGGHGRGAAPAEKPDGKPGKNGREAEGRGEGRRHEGRDGQSGEGREGGFREARNGESDGRGYRHGGEGQRGETNGEHRHGDEGQRSETDGEHRHGGRDGHERGHGRHRSPFAHWQEVYEAQALSNPGYRQISLSEGVVSVVPKGRNSLRAADRYEFDARTGEITGTQLYKDQDKSGKMRGVVYTVHVGSWGGMVTRIITFLAALLGATLPLTGYYLWIRRLTRKRGGQHPHH